MKHSVIVVWSLLFLSVTTAVENKMHSKEKRLFWGEPERCFDSLGCFVIKEFKDSHRADPYLPQPLNDVNTRFLVYTKENQPGSGTEKLINYDNETFANSSGFKHGLPVTFITHGFQASGKADWVLNVTKTILALKDVNVIVVDWEDGASGSNSLLIYNKYKQAASNTWLVGKQIAKLCEFLKDKFGVTYDNVHLIGHSLGSHVSGYAGATLNGKIGRITALDPAEPEFQNTAPHIRLDPTDAQFVDAIHTDGKPYYKITGWTGFGMKQPVGVVDFYPNGGLSQPGCLSKRDTNSNAKKRDAGDPYIACQHSRAYRYFLETIATESEDSCDFMAHECESYENYLKGKCNSCGDDGSKCLRMGYYANKYTNPNKSVNHMFYLSTTDTSPFCIYHYGIEMTGKSSRQLSFTLMGELSSHSFNFQAKSREPISLVTGSRQKLGSIKKATVECSDCNDTTAKITVVPIDIIDETKRTSESSVLCHIEADGDYHIFKKC